MVLSPPDVVGGQADVAGESSTMSTTSNLLSKVSIIVLGVTDISKSVAFYRDTLGLPTSAQSDDLAFVTTSTVTLMLSTELARAYHPTAGATEIVFGVEGVTAVHSALKGRGCTFIKDPREVNAGSWAATLVDPDGHKLTLFGSR
jgi:predicted enzyme related to lactoylglutathione lyase